jgi:hypothetical protein
MKANPLPRKKFKRIELHHIPAKHVVKAIFIFLDTDSMFPNSNCTFYRKIEKNGNGLFRFINTL